ncbi:hypothetical protein ACFX15_021354 [Malus domestica]
MVFNCLFLQEVKGAGAGLTAAALIAMGPSHISCSVAGSYDNEVVAIFALVFTLYLYIRLGIMFNVLQYLLITLCNMQTLNTGSLFYATLTAIAYFYMVVLGTLLAALVPVVGFNAVMTSEHFASFLVSISQLSFLIDFSFSDTGACLTFRLFSKHL